MPTLARAGATLARGPTPACSPPRWRERHAGMALRPRQRDRPRWRGTGHAGVKATLGSLAQRGVTLAWVAAMAWKGSRWRGCYAGVERLTLAWAAALARGGSRWRACHDSVRVATLAWVAALA